MEGEGAPFMFSLDDIDFSPSLVFDNLTAGEYTVYMIDSDGCTSSRNIEVGEVPPISIPLEDVYVLCGDAVLDIDLLPNINSSQNVSVEWDDGTTFTSRTITEEGKGTKIVVDMPI